MARSRKHGKTLCYKGSHKIDHSFHQEEPVGQHRNLTKLLLRGEQHKTPALKAQHIVSPPMVQASGRAMGWGTWGSYMMTSAGKKSMAIFSTAITPGTNLMPRRNCGFKGCKTCHHRHCALVRCYEPTRLPSQATSLFTRAKPAEAHHCCHLWVQQIGRAHV